MQNKIAIPSEQTYCLMIYLTEFPSIDQSLEFICSYNKFGLISAIYTCPFSVIFATFTMYMICDTT